MREKLLPAEEVPAHENNIPMPAGFKYKEVFLKGRPRHDKYSSFYGKHPPMPPEHWAKIFSPFDALKGFDERIAEKEILYTYRRCPEGDSGQKLDAKLRILHDLTRSGRMARDNRVSASVTFFVPRKGSAPAENVGTYRTVSGIIWNVDNEVSGTLRLDNLAISLEDIADITIKA